MKIHGLLGAGARYAATSVQPLACSRAGDASKLEGGVCAADGSLIARRNAAAEMPRPKPEDTRPDDDDASGLHSPGRRDMLIQRLKGQPAPQLVIHARRLVAGHCSCGLMAGGGQVTFIKRDPFNPGHARVGIGSRSLARGPISQHRRAGFGTATASRQDQSTG